MKIKLITIALVSMFTLGCTKADTSANNSSDNAKKDAKKDKVFSFSNEPIVPEAISSLRGNHSLRALSNAPVENKIIKNGDYETNYDDQPPLVPHKSDYMRVTIKNNQCLACHSNANYREEESAKMPSSHFKTRSGKRLKTVSPRRYFCKQCHVSQVDAQPLVGNTYVNTDE